MKAVYVLASVALYINVLTCLDPQLDSEWENWRIKFQKQGTRVGDVQRREIWEANYRAVEEHNQRFQEGNATYKMGMNQFGDLTPEEFLNLTQMTMSRPNTRSNNQLTGEELRKAASSLSVTSIDYRTLGYVTPVENQGSCGCCWAFSAAGALEAQWMNKTKQLIPLSKQQLMDCSGDFGNRGCNGGLPFVAYEYIQSIGGIQAEATYPYAMTKQVCAADKSKFVATVKGWMSLPSGNEQALEDALVTIGPVAITIDSTTPSFQFYQSGVFYDPQCTNWKQNHAMVVVGFGTEGTDNYWIIKNSWGTSWGENGYLLLAKDQGDECGVSQNGVIPLV
ncbi:cathepsin K-like [Amia ocellicauda]|uniref:cathepsin K-like n=1 Tax=Amia ocellicauda TaxID=2972642 RepID=UPI003464823C